MLHERWWEEKNLDDNGQKPNCAEGDKEQVDTPELGMDNVGGVFLVLGVGLLISLFLGSLEFFWSVRKTSMEYKVNYAGFHFH